MTTLLRRPDWQARLIKLANERRLTPYRYGDNDCWQFARAAVETMTGVLLCPEMKPYRGFVGAAKVLIDNGWDTVEDMATELLGTSVDHEMSRPGDIVSYEAVGERHLAVRVGDAALTPAQFGTTAIPRTAWLRCWKVG